MYIASPYRNASKSARLNGKGYMGISLDSHSHSGEALEATIDWLNRNTQYSMFLIGLSDTLNRFNLLSSHSEKKACEICLKKGNEWIEINQKILDKLKTPHKILRWDHWKENYPYKTKQYTQLFENLFDNDIILKAALIKDISSFVSRRYNTIIDNVPFETILNCKNYLIEELAIYSIIFENYANCEVYYPGKQLECMKVIRENLVQAVPNTFEETRYIRMALHQSSQKQVA